MTIELAPLLAGFEPLAGHHRRLIADTARTGAMIAAVEAAVRPGDVVVDLGTGTGVLAIAAARAGARRVYAIERTAVARAAAEVVAANGASGVVEVIRTHSRDAAIAEPVDLVVSECFGPMAIGGTMLQAVHRLAARCLRPGGAVIPRRVDVYLAPLESAEAERALGFWDEPRRGISLAPIDRYTRNNLYRVEAQPEQLVAEPARIASIDPRVDDFAGALAVAVEARARRDARVVGWLGWFEADLGGDVTLATGPGASTTVWGQTLFPLACPAPIERGEAIAVRFATAPSADPSHCLHWRWATSLRGRETRQSTELSEPRGG